MDHGILNLPLSKRGNIDREIDRYKAAQAAGKRSAACERRKQMKADREIAVRLLGEAAAERIEGLASKCGVTTKVMRDELRRKAYWEPKVVIGVLG